MQQLDRTFTGVRQRYQTTYYWHKLTHQLAEREDQYGMTIDCRGGSKYRPAFIADRSHNADNGLCAAACTRALWSTGDAYWPHVKLTHQRGQLCCRTRVHLGDHEPTIVRVDSDGRTTE